ncbi:MAG TPA: hypothetical protein VEJ00_03630, partial [Candidatus Acidoferrales bacterium]|nr:hypothetical protein [Candidatus Acidoferrales bacterium]
SGAGQPGDLNSFAIFQGVPLGVPGNPCSPATSAATATAMDYSPSQQRFSCAASGTSCGVTSQSIFINQGYLNPSTFLPVAFQPFGYPQSKNFVYAYAQQANFSLERDLGGGFALNLAYNFNGGRHLNRPINANAIRGDLMTANFFAAVADATAAGTAVPANPLFVTGCSPGGSPTSPLPFVDSSLMGFFRPSGLNPSIIGAYQAIHDPQGCIGQAVSLVHTLPGIDPNCDPATFNGCIPLGDMDANYSNGSSVYHGFSANLRKRFNNHYEFLASYTWSHAIDDSTDLQATLTPQDSFYPALDRSSSLFDQRNRFVFSGVYQTGKLGSHGFAGKVFSDWTFAPVIEVSSGRPYNIITGNGDNLQLSSLTGRPNTFVNPACTAQGNQPLNSKASPTGVFQEPCISGFTGTLLSLDGNLGRNAGITPWTLFDDMRVSKRINFSERINMDLIADMFNIANRYNVAAVTPQCCTANPANPTQSTTGQATAAWDPRQFQFAMKVNW